MSTHWSSIIIIVALLLVPVAIWAEDANLQVWQNELVAPVTTPEPNRHTPQFTDGTFLPPVIDKNLALTAADNPIILAFNTRVAPNTALTLSPGTHVYTHEFTELTIAGQLDIQGTSDQPVTFSSNELHPLNQTWGGIIVAAAGLADISHLNTQHGSPALSCLAESQVTVDNSELSAQQVAVYSESSNCTVNNSLIRSTDTGLISVGNQPQLFNTNIYAHVRPFQVVQN